jgi:hypothetical protein
MIFQMVYSQYNLAWYIMSQLLLGKNLELGMLQVSTGQVHKTLIGKAKEKKPHGIPRYSLGSEQAF